MNRPETPRSGGDATTEPDTAKGLRPARSARIAADRVTVGYDREAICSELSLQIPDGSFTAIIGPNGCGKSTLLRGFAGVLSPRAGQILINGEPIAALKPRQVARELGLLPQTSLAPDGITVADLVSRGRAPYQGLFAQWTPADERAVARALELTRLTEMSGRFVEELSGGQRQRVRVAMLLAQETPILLLDEPTTFLDMSHQYELMELFRTFHEAGKTIVAVLHDLNQAARYADHLVVMRDGAIVATGAPAEIVTTELIESVFGLRVIVVPDPVTGTPSVVPLDPRSPRPAADSSTSAPTTASTRADQE